MDVEKFLNSLDNLFEKKKINEVPAFLEENYKEAVRENDLSAQFTILNEMMGFFRDISEYEKSIKACHQCIDVMQKMGIQGSVHYATSLQNIANAHRAAGLLKEALQYYMEAFRVYERNIDSNDYRFASLHNNIALLYQEIGDYETAVAHLKKALSIIKNIQGAEIEVATTYSNLGASLVELDKVDEALEYLNKALKIYRRDEVKNFHYSGALCAMAGAMCKKHRYYEAENLYREALGEIEINMGKGTAYKITKDNLEKVENKLKNMEGNLNRNTEKNISGLQLAKGFYEEYGAPMIAEKFKEYEDKIAVGFVGEGSERFGFDDIYSRDHDFGPGFSMWVTKSTYDLIGEKLQAEYEKLPKEYMGVRRMDTEMAKGRLGVCLIGDFYEKYTGYRQSPEKVSQWIDIDDDKLATVTNGEVFRDNEGIFTDIRNHFRSQPEKARIIKLAREVSKMAQTGQSNYGRSMARKDYVSANICISEFIKSTMHCIYILNGMYSPYYKWMAAGIKKYKLMPQVMNLLEELSVLNSQKAAWDNYAYDNTSYNKEDKAAVIIEEVAKMIIKELKNQRIVNNINSDFLNDYVPDIVSKAEFDREKVINDIIHLEFDAFDKVNNKGGRAQCQDNWPVFYVMRKSQYLTWTDDMLITIRDLWLDNKEKGINMITEKYGRMMESTVPEEYEEIKDNFPPKSEKAKEIVNQIAQIQVEWMKDFAKSYPKLAANARDITSEADYEYNASYETYLKGELLTYSDRLLLMYADFIVDLYKNNKNLAEMTIENTAKMQGYKSLEEAEASLK